MKIEKSCRCLMFLVPAVVASLQAVGQTERVADNAFPPANGSHRILTFAQRVAYQRAIEGVYWRHRIWSKERPEPKPPLDAVMTQAQLEEKVADYLRKSQVLQDYWKRPITGAELQAEMDRMAQNTRQADVLQELFDALGNDPFVIAECLARPVLSERLGFFVRDNEPLESSRARAEKQIPDLTGATTANYMLPVISDEPSGCIDDTWTATSTTNAASARAAHTAIWTGSEMIVWGGYDVSNVLNTGGRYSPSTDSWTPTSTTNAPVGRYHHTAVWTGSEMIVWGGYREPNTFNTGGRYNPTTDTWAATSTINAPNARAAHTAVWTGGEMIVWGGDSGDNTGGRYDPTTDSWTVTSTINAPHWRFLHTAVWTGSEMIVWGGTCGPLPCGTFNTGGKYNPTTDSWIATSTTDAPVARALHTAVWTGSEMIVWGGYTDLNTGGRYNPSMDSWVATSTINAPEGRFHHTAVWTGSEMIVWGGSIDYVNGFNSGARYNPNTDLWIATTTTNAPTARQSHTAVWSGSDMIVWGGIDQGAVSNTGGRYCAQSGPTPTPTPSPTVTPTPTATPTVTPRPSSTPRPRPTPHPRPTP